MNNKSCTPNTNGYYYTTPTELGGCQFDNVISRINSIDNTSYQYINQQVSNSKQVEIFPCGDKTHTETNKVNEAVVNTAGLKYRMYVFVERHLSSIDKGIQSAHAIAEYMHRHPHNGYKWARDGRTIVVLEGGNVNDLVNIEERLIDNCIDYSFFEEEDLGNVITAIAVLVPNSIYEARRNYIPFGAWCDEHNKDVDDEHNKKYWEQDLGGSIQCTLMDLICSHHLAR